MFAKEIGGLLILHVQTHAGVGDRSSTGRILEAKERLGAQAGFLERFILSRLRQSGSRGAGATGFDRLGIARFPNGQRHDHGRCPAEQGRKINAQDELIRQRVLKARVKQTERVAECIRLGTRAGPGYFGIGIRHRGDLFDLPLPNLATLS